MTNKDAARIAIECIQKEMHRIAFDANVAMRDPQAPPSMQVKLTRYQQYAKAVKHFQAVLAQGEM